MIIYFYFGGNRIILEEIGKKAKNSAVFDMDFDPIYIWFRGEIGAVLVCDRKG
jgi:hypothetical protein